MLFTHSMVCWPRLLSSTPVRLVCLIKPSITFHMPSTPSPVTEHVYAPVVQPSVAGLKYLSTCSYSALAACARCLLSPSALLTSIASAVSITPFFMPCRSSPAPAMVITKKKSTIALTEVSFWPTPTVSTNMVSKPAASQSSMVSLLFLVTPPSVPPEGDGLIKASGRLASFSILVLSPSMLPLDMALVGSTASTATLLPLSQSMLPKHSINVLLPAPGTPVMPTRTELPVCGSILLIIS